VAPSPWSVDRAWDEALVVVALALAYALVARRYGASRPRMAAFGLGCALALAALISPIATVGLHYLLSAHLLQNVMLAEWAPALIVLGVPPALAARIARVPGVPTLTRPLVALPLWILSYAVWHVPAAYDAALAHAPVIRLEHLCYFVTGCLLWWPVFQDEPHRVSSGQRAAYVFAAFLFASPLGLLLALLPDSIYSTYENAPRIWGVGPTEDQQIAGVIMAGSEAIVFFAIFAVFIVRFLAEEEIGDPERLR
jgi:putative membrane protein